MSTHSSDKAFTGSMATIYERYLVPLIFEPYADDMTHRLVSRSAGRVLEVAAGTGVVTRRLADQLPERCSIVATDLNQGMMDQATALKMGRPVEWRAADAMSLPFDDASFDAVVCQFGVMFFPDKPKAFREALRVLKPGGVYLFNVWDRISENEVADIVTTSLGSVFPSDPPRFLPRTPYGYFDRAAIERDLASAGLAPTEFTTLTARSRAEAAWNGAIAFCQGTPLRGEIEARNPSGLDAATDVAAEAVAQRFGRGAIDAKIQAHVVTVEKS